MDKVLRNLHEIQRRLLDDAPKRPGCQQQMRDEAAGVAMAIREIERAREAEKFDARDLTREIIALARRYDPDGPSLRVNVSLACGGNDIVDALLEDGAELEAAVYGRDGQEPYVIESATLRIGNVEICDQRLSRTATAEEAAQLDGENVHRCQDEFRAATVGR